MLKVEQRLLLLFDQSRLMNKLIIMEINNFLIVIKYQMEVGK